MDLHENELFRHSEMFYENEGEKENHGLFQVEGAFNECYNDSIEIQNNIFIPHDEGSFEIEENIRKLKKEIANKSQLVEKIKKLTKACDDKEKEKAKILKEMYQKTKANEEAMKKQEYEITNSKYLINQLQAKISKQEEILRSCKAKDLNKEEELKKSVQNLKNDLSNKSQIINKYEDKLYVMEQKLKRKKEKLTKARQSLKELSDELNLKRDRERMIDKFAQTDEQIETEIPNNISILSQSDENFEKRIEKVQIKYKNIKRKMNQVASENQMLSEKFDHLSDSLKRKRAVDVTEIEAIIPDVVKKVCLEKDFITELSKKVGPLLRDMVLTSTPNPNLLKRLLLDETDSPKERSEDVILLESPKSDKSPFEEQVSEKYDMYTEDSSSSLADCQELANNPSGMENEERRDRINEEEKNEEVGQDESIPYPDTALKLKKDNNPETVDESEKKNESLIEVVPCLQEPEKADELSVLGDSKSPCSVNVVEDQASLGIKNIDDELRKGGDRPKIMNKLDDCLIMNESKEEIFSNSTLIFHKLSHPQCLNMNKLSVTNEDEIIGNSNLLKTSPKEKEVNQDEKGMICEEETSKPGPDSTHFEFEQRNNEVTEQKLPEESIEPLSCQNQPKGNKNEEFEEGEIGGLSNSNGIPKTANFNNVNSEEINVKIKKKVSNPKLHKAPYEQASPVFHIQETLKNKIEFFKNSISGNSSQQRGFLTCLELLYEIYSSGCTFLSDSESGLYSSYIGLLKIYLQYFNLPQGNFDELLNTFLGFFNRLSSFNETSFIATMFLKITNDMWGEISCDTEKLLLGGYLQFCEKVIVDFPLNSEAPRNQTAFFKDLNRSDQLKQLEFLSEYFLKDLSKDLPVMQEILVFTNFVVNYQTIISSPQNYTFDNCINFFGKRLDQMNPLKLCAERMMLFLISVYGLKRAGAHYERKAVIIQKLMNLLQRYRNPKGNEKESNISKGNITNLLYVVVILYPDILTCELSSESYNMTKQNSTKHSMIEVQPLSSLNKEKYNIDETVKPVKCSLISLRATLLIFLRDLIKDSKRETDVTKGQIMVLAIYSAMRGLNKASKLKSFFAQNLLELKDLKLNEAGRLKLINPKFDEIQFLKILIDELLDDMEKKLYQLDDVVRKENGEITNIHINIRDFFNSIYHLFKFIFLPIPFPKEITPIEDGLFKFFVHERIKGYFVNGKYQKTLQKTIAESILKLLQKWMQEMSPKYAHLVRNIAELLSFIEPGNNDGPRNFFFASKQENSKPLNNLLPIPQLLPAFFPKRNQAPLCKEIENSIHKTVNTFIPTLPRELLEFQESAKDY